MGTNDGGDRYVRQAAIVPSDKIAGLRCMVVGVGAIGRQVALQLASIGATNIVIIDPDIVSLPNVVTQGYKEADLSWYKVSVLGPELLNINSELELNSHKKKFTRADAAGVDVVFVCVDDIEVRGFIFKCVKDNCIFFVDGRMAAETLRVLTVCNREMRGITEYSISIEDYESTLFKSAEAHPAPCTAKSTVYCANVAAGFMLAQFTKWLRGFEVESDLMLNLLAMELTVGGIE
ncbi:hypothetical protein LCGC14_0475830 [marine sediment metagenome]|uniref:THIF-type NAD/FAD binding fold domain-containing protein n=1 Tax=marine sediment metagenome TaxID=412755 RepID=A0A0F9UXQ5_9ZZZZ